MVGVTSILDRRQLVLQRRLRLPSKRNEFAKIRHDLYLGLPTEAMLCVIIIIIIMQRLTRHGVGHKDDESQAQTDARCKWCISRRYKTKKAFIRRRIAT